MFRFLFGSEAVQGAPPADFGVPFPGAYVSLLRPQTLFCLSSTHIAAPPSKGKINQIASGVPFVPPAAISVVRSPFARASAATRVNVQGLIEVVPVETLRTYHDPITLQPKGLLLEEARTNLISRSNDLTSWTKSRATVTNSTDFPIFANEGVFPNHKRWDIRC